MNSPRPTKQHPFLADLLEPTLYLHNVPPQLTSNLVFKTFVTCGALLGVRTAGRTGNKVKYSVQYKDVFSGKLQAALDDIFAIAKQHGYIAEMAFVTLQGQPLNFGDSQSYIIRISLSQNDDSLPSWNPTIHPIFVPSNPTLRQAPDARQKRFKEFRAFGPLVHVDTDVDLGLHERGDLIHYWTRSDAEAAINHVQRVLKGWTKIVDLSQLKITVPSIIPYYYRL
jgi:hypothetical protein